MHTEGGYLRYAPSMSLLRIRKHSAEQTRCCGQRPLIYSSPSVVSQRAQLRERMDLDDNYVEY